MCWFELHENAVELVAVADVDLLELEPVDIRNGRQILKIPCVGELVDHADCIRCVVDDMTSHGRPDKTSAGYNDALLLYGETIRE